MLKKAAPLAVPDLRARFKGRGRPESVMGLPGLKIETLRTRPLKLFSVDVEDWFHNNFTSAPRLDVSTLERRVEVGVDRLLEALSAVGSRGTFFVLGNVAEEHPALVKRYIHGRYAQHSRAARRFSRTRTRVNSTPNRGPSNCRSTSAKG